jgi:hypothetical protein
VKAFGRFVSGDWGDISEHDRKSNSDILAGLKQGGRLWAVYRDIENTKFWIITDTELNCTTILLPEDY